MMRRRYVLVGGAFFLGFLCDYLVWGKPIDYAFPFFMFISLLTSWVVLLASYQRFPAGRSALLFLPPLFFSITAALTKDSPTSLKHILSMVFTFLFLGLLSTTYFGGQLDRYTFWDYPRAFFQLALSMLWQPAHFLLVLIRDLQEASRNRPRNDDRRSMGCALVVAVLSFVLLFTLLCLADSAFVAVITPLPGNNPPPVEQPVPSTPPPNPYVATPLGTLLWSYLILGLFLYAGTQSWNERLVADNPRIHRRWFNYNGSTIIIASMIVPLFTYTILRTTCLLNPIMCINGEGLPAGIYIPHGFWELAFSIVFVLLVTCWLGYKTVFNNRADRRLHTYLNLFLFGNALLVLINAGIYVSTGMALIHVHRHVWYARGGLVWLGTMLGMFILYEDIESEHDFPYAALLVTTFMSAAFVVLRIWMGSDW